MNYTVFFLIKYHSSEILVFICLPIDISSTNEYIHIYWKVYFQKASEVSNNNLSNLFKLYKETTLRLIKIGIIPFILVLSFSSIFIKFIFDLIGNIQRNYADYVFWYFFNLLLPNFNNIYNTQ